MRILQGEAHELLAICKEWILYFSDDGRMVCGEATDEFKVLYARMCDAIEAADPGFWSGKYTRLRARRDRERAA